MNVLLILIGAGVQGPFYSKTNPEAYADSYFLLMQAETVDTRIPRILSGNTTNHFVIKFDHPLGSSEREFVKGTGLKIEAYLPNYSYLVSGDVQKVQQLLQDKKVSWASQYEPLWKIAPSLLNDPSYPDTLHLWLFDDANISGIARRLVSDFHATVYSTHDGINKLILASFDPSLLADIAAINEVRWIEPFHAPRFHNNQAQWVLQSWKENIRSIWAKGLLGQGVVTSTGDAGITTTHVAFRDSNIVISDWGDFPSHRKIIAYKPSSPGAVFGDIPGYFYHGSHTAGTVCGDDSYWGYNEPYNGMAPEAKLYFIDIGSANGIAYPEDYNEMYLMPWSGNEGGRAKLMSNSWGSGGEYRTYDLPCRQTDEFMWNHPDFLVFYSAGNYGSVSPPSTAKNTVSVAATLNGANAYLPASFSSPGYTMDNRIKPTLSAPGVLVSAYGGSNDGYATLEGTSMSSPAAAGACALIAEYLREGWYPSGTHGFNASDSIEPSAALLKAMLISSTIADFPENPIPDSKVGWGRMCVDSVLYFQGKDKQLYLYDNTIGIETGDEAQYTAEVTGQTWPLRVTLVWTDYPGDPAASKQLVNDLDLEASAPSGELYRGNVFADNFSKTGGAKDAVNVEECLRISTPETGTWKIRIKGANIPEGPEPYAIVITGMIDVGQPELSLEGIRIDDSSSIEPNQTLDPGESVTLYPRFLNAGDATADDVQVNLSTTDSLLTVTDGEADYGSIEPGLAVEGEGFQVELSPEAEPDREIKMKALVSIAGGAYLDMVEFYIIVGRIGVDEFNCNAKPLLISPGLVADEASLRMYLPSTRRVTLELFDATGRKLGTLVDRRFDAGTYSLPLEIKGARGVYFISFSTGDFRERVKIVKLGK